MSIYRISIAKPTILLTISAHFSGLAPQLMRTRGKCKGVRGIKCTPADENRISYTIKQLSSKYPDLYNDLTRHLLRNS